MRRRDPLIAALALLALPLAACATGAYDPDGDDDSQGELFDQEHPGIDLESGKEDRPGYPVPTVPTLVAPEIIVSLDGLTVHLFDRVTGFQAVYPAGVGVKNSAGRSVTPTGHFATSPNTGDTWFYIARRWVPDYFAGFPFLRIDAVNKDGANTYGLHGPITETLIRGYVSHGCVRMASQDIIELFWMVRKHPSTPVTIQTEVERDAAGEVVDVGTSPAMWLVGEPIQFGASVGPRRP
jgi:lipoprotein-anchoring transpeptidase ErfK/SrfK